MTLSSLDTSPRRSRWQFSLRTMLLATALVAVLLVANRYQPGGAWIALLWPALVGLFWCVAVVICMPLWYLFGWRHASTLGGKIVIAARTPFAVLMGRTPAWVSWVPLSLMALLCCILLAGSWIAWGQFGLLIEQIAIGAVRDKSWGNAASEEWTNFVSNAKYLKGGFVAEAWSLARWLVLFGLLTFTASLPRPGLKSPHSRADDLLLRFLAFVPWFVVVEFGCLCGAWLLHPHYAPVLPYALFGEPNEGWGINLVGWQSAAEKHWLMQITVPTFAVGLVYFRRVLGFNGPWRVLLSATLVPAALSVSVLSEWLYLAFYLQDPIRLGR